MTSSKTDKVEGRFPYYDLEIKHSDAFHLGLVSFLRNLTKNHEKPL